MALERQSIEKKDFPIGRRGYDPEAVDAHLHALAEEVEELKRSTRRRTETLASSASEQVRAIVEAAETSAADIQRQAEEEAEEIRGEATGEARSTREQASAQAQEYVGKVSESTSGMLQRLEAMQSELGTLLEALRTGGHRLNADLQLLDSDFSEVQQAVSPRPRFEREAGVSAQAQAPAPPPAAAPPAPVSPEGPPAPPAPVPEALDDAPGLDLSGGPQAGGGDTDDSESARLTALNMALDGTPREEAERFLEQHYRLTDRRGLLDEVYTSVEG